jgi:hypothetical protein
VEEMVALVNNNLGQDVKKSQLSKQDMRVILAICAELVDLCARLTGKIDPTSAAMLSYVRDEIVSESEVELQ